jgi:hypothetical protein
MKVTDIIKEHPYQEWLILEANTAYSSPLGSYSPTGTKNSAVWGKVTSRLSKSPINGSPLPTKGLKVVGNLIRVAQWFNYYDFLVNYWNTKDVIEQMIKDGPGKGGLSKEDGEVAIRLQREKLFVDLISGGIINAIVIKMIRIIPFAKWFSRGAGALLEIFTGGLATAGVVGQMLLVEAVSIKLQNWLNTDDGKRVVTWCVMYLIDPGVELFWSLGCERFFGKLQDLSTHGGEVLDKNTAVSGTPGHDVLSKAEKALGSAGQWAADKIDSATGTTHIGDEVRKIRASNSSSSSTPSSTPSGTPNPAAIAGTSAPTSSPVKDTSPVMRPGDIDPKHYKSAP